MPKVKKTRLRNFCFTLNNYKPDQIESLKKYEHFKYLIFGKEIGESGTPHLQGYAELKKQTSFNVVRKYMFNAHIEARHGTPQQASDYCQKEDKEPYIDGIMSNPGKRTDIEDIKTMANEGASLYQVMTECPASWRFLSATRLYMNLAANRGVQKHRNIEVTVIYGVSDSGKSHYVTEREPQDLYWVPNSAGKWFDGYDGQEAILFDDFYGEIDFSFWLRLLDKYHLMLPVKGSFTPARYTRVYITSNTHPSTWYTDTHGAFKRRITHMIHKTEKYSKEVGLVLPPPLSTPDSELVLV